MDLILHNLKVPATEDFLKDIKKLWNTIHQRETQQDIQDKSRASKAQRQSNIQVEDLIMLRTRHLVLKAISRKLKPRFIGLLRVEAQVGANTFKLTLPQCKFTKYSTSHFYNPTRESINLQALLK